jgi:hypothetical protein
MDPREERALTEAASVPAEGAIRKDPSPHSSAGAGSSAPLPPFIADQVRQREAYHMLLRDLNMLLGDDWSTQPSEITKGRINKAIGDSLSIWI